MQRTVGYLLISIYVAAFLFIPLLALAGFESFMLDAISVFGNGGGLFLLVLYFVPLGVGPTFGARLLIAALTLGTLLWWSITRIQRESTWGNVLAATLLQAIYVACVYAVIMYGAVIILI